MCRHLPKNNMEVEGAPSKTIILCMIPVHILFQMREQSRGFRKLKFERSKMCQETAANTQLAAKIPESQRSYSQASNMSLSETVSCPGGTSMMPLMYFC